MATKNPTTTGPKPSFASIAAMAPPAHDGRGAVLREVNLVKSPDLPVPVPAAKSAVDESASTAQVQQELPASLSRLTVRGDPPMLHGPLDQDHSTTLRSGLRFDDNQTQISSSSTKPASLDGKSTTSGTTFALDEKESLRPDDSASVKAADEEDFYSGSASGAPNSRVGSEAGSRAFRDQFYEISERIGPGSHRSHPTTRRGIPGIEEEGPQISLPPTVSTLPAPITLPGPENVAKNGASFGYEYQEPDEKLFEALESPKDRLFLLRLEQDVITFVRDSQDPILDLPPCNSFCRLLAHKLADYYALTHFVDNAVSAVRLYRTPYCRIPAPLNAISKLPASAEAIPACQPAVKIMRRAGLGKDGQPLELGARTNASSMGPSKSGSETGDGGTGVGSPTDSTSAKDRASMTREEREAKYKETRERIFKGFEDCENVEADSTAGNDTSNEVSRTNSANEKKRSKKLRNNDDGFQARSQFNAYYPAMQYPATNYDQSTNTAAYFGPYAPQPVNTISHAGTMNATMFQQNYSQAYQSMSNASGYPVSMQQNLIMNGSSINGQNTGSPTSVGYSQLMPAQYYQPMQQPMVGHPSPAMSSPVLSNNAQLSRPQSQMSDQQWSQNSYPYPYQLARNQQQIYPSPSQDRPSVPTVPYQYGQLPYQSNQQGGKASHPLPGSYNRQSFNPQTRAFVPSTGFVPPQIAPYGSGLNESMTRSGPGSVFSTPNQMQPYSQQLSPYLQMPSSSSLSMMPPLSGAGSFSQLQDPKPYGTRKSSAPPSSGPQSPGQSSLSKWGTPAHLPPKPPPPEVPTTAPQTHHTLPINIHANINIQTMSNGQPMPSYQNGVYSIPGAGTS